MHGRKSPHNTSALRERTALSTGKCAQREQLPSPPYCAVTESSLTSSVLNAAIMANGHIPAKATQVENQTATGVLATARSLLTKPTRSQRLNQTK